MIEGNGNAKSKWTTEGIDVTEDRAMSNKDNMSEPQPNAKLPDPVEIELEPSSYQPTKTEMKEEFDTPAWTMDQLREVFMRPFVTKDS